MPKTSKGIGQAWFYHAPAKPSSSERVPAPPISQIQDLNGYCCQQPEQDQQQKKRNIVYETDSNYIRLAKQGGRPDLLNMMPKDCGSSSEPVGYPICDWYYDCTTTTSHQNGNNNTESYTFKLPAYMVHPEPAPRQSNDGYIKISSEGPPTMCKSQKPAPTECGGLTNSNGNNRRVARKPVRLPDKFESNPPCKPPSDHIGPNAIHKY